MQHKTNPTQTQTDRTQNKPNTDTARSQQRNHTDQLTWFR